MHLKRRVFPAIAIAILIGYRFFMWDNNKYVTYSYIFLEFLSIICLLLYNRWRIIKPQKELVVCFLLLGYIFVLTVLEGTVTYSYICLLIGELFLCLFIVNNIKTNSTEMISLFSDAIFGLFVVDVISVLIAIITKNHTNDSFGIVGHKNYHAFFFVLTIGFSAINTWNTRKKIFDIKNLIISIIALSIEIIVHSASGLVAVGLLILLMFFADKKRFKLVKLNIIIWGLLGVSAILVFGFENSGLLRIISLLGRDSGLTGRSAIWTKVLELIQQRYLYGYGFYKTIYIYFVDLGWIYNHAHNFFLNLVVSGGVIYAVITLVLLFRTAYELDSKQTVINYLLTIITGCYMLLGISEIIVNVNTMFLPLLLICFYSKHMNTINTPSIIRKRTKLVHKR